MYNRNHPVNPSVHSSVHNSHKYNFYKTDEPTLMKLNTFGPEDVYEGDKSLVDWDVFTYFLVTLDLV